MKISYWPEYRALNSDQPYHAFLDSLQAENHTLIKESLDCDAAVIWSVLWDGRMRNNQSVWEHYRKQNKPVFVVEVGGIKRGTTWKVGLNGVNRGGYFGPTGNDHTRSVSLGLECKSWRTDGEYILIYGQHEKSLQWIGMPRMSQWAMNTIEQLQIHYDYPIVFRPHPRCKLEHIEHQYKNVYRQEPKKLADTYDDYDMTFDNVKFTVSWNSNPGIHSAINGVPVFAGPDSLAFDVSSPHLLSVDNPRMPDRQQWLNDYAWTEYTVEEISQGIPLKRLESKLYQGNDSVAMS